MKRDSTKKEVIIDDKSQGKKNYGEWTLEEHKDFLSGIEKYGNIWGKVTNCVKTRDCKQVRSHAQKYFRSQESSKLKMITKNGLVNSAFFLVIKQYFHCPKVKPKQKDSKNSILEQYSLAHKKTHLLDENLNSSEKSVNNEDDDEITDLLNDIENDIIGTTTNNKEKFD